MIKHYYISGLLILFSVLPFTTVSAQSTEADKTVDYIPEFALSMLTIPEATVSDMDLKQRLSLVNVYASWCEACTAERSILMAIRATTDTPIYGVNVKDKRMDAIKWLASHGDPYERSAFDDDGELMSGLSVDSLPQTLVVNKSGKIIYRFRGALDKRIWLLKLWPYFQSQP